MVSENDVLIIKSSLNENILLQYALKLADNCSYPSNAATFQLFKRANIDKLAAIANEGVRHITMSAVANSLSVEHAERRDQLQRRSRVKKTIDATLEHIHAALGIEDEVPEDAENLKVEVHLKFDKRTGTHLDQAHIRSIANAIVNDDDEGFVIETFSGTKVRAEDVVLGKTVRLEKYGKTVRYTDAWGEMLDYYVELNQ